MGAADGVMSIDDAQLESPLAKLRKSSSLTAIHPIFDII